MVERVGRVIDDGSIVLLLLLLDVLPTGVVVERGRLEARHLAGAGVPRRYIEPDIDEIVVVVQRTLAAQFPMVQCVIWNMGVGKIYRSRNQLHSPEPGKRKSCRCSYQPSSVVPARVRRRLTRFKYSAYFVSYSCWLMSICGRRRGRRRSSRITSTSACNSNLTCRSYRLSMGMLTDHNMYEEEYDEAAEMLVVYDPEPEIDSTSSILPQKTPLDEHSYFFSAERTLELIAIVESEPLLWDKTQLDYKNVKMTENAWRIVASKMELDVEVCKEKWTCLRAQFRKLKRRMIQSSQNGTGTDEIYQPSWYAYEAMAFLNEAVECEGDTNTVDGNNTQYCTANTKPKPSLDEYAHSLSRENTLELVSIIEGLPVLWNRANRDNKYTKKADDAWKEVARKMSVDVDVCKEKWAAMRAQFRRIRGKVLQSTSKEGSGSDQIYRPSWYAYEAMTFLNRAMDYGKASNMTYGNIPERTEATFVENNYFLSNENTLEFIAVVESHPLLWNKAHPDYGNVKRLEDTWQLVADEMDLDVEDCKDKWNSLRAQFRRLRRKILQSSEDATGSDQIYQPSWYAYDAMTFLTDVIQHGKAKKRRLSSPRPKPEPQSNSNAPRTATVRKSDDGFFLDSLEILNADDDEGQEQLSSIDGSPYPSDDEEEEYLEEQEQLLAGEDYVERLDQTCNGAENPPQSTEEDAEVSSRQPCDSERQRIAPFIEILSQRLLRKEKVQLEEIENELLKVLNKYPNARID